MRKIFGAKRNDSRIAYVPVEISRNVIRSNNSFYWRSELTALERNQKRQLVGFSSYEAALTDAHERGEFVNGIAELFIYGKIFAEREKYSFSNYLMSQLFVPYCQECGKPPVEAVVRDTTEEVSFYCPLHNLAAEGLGNLNLFSPKAIHTSLEDFLLPRLPWPTLKLQSKAIGVLQFTKLPWQPQQDALQDTLRGAPMTLEELASYRGAPRVKLSQHEQKIRFLEQTLHSTQASLAEKISLVEYRENQLRALGVAVVAPEFEKLKEGL